MHRRTLLALALLALVVQGLHSAESACQGQQGSCSKGRLPNGFVYLADVCPTIIEDVKYYGHHNFHGRPVPGYEAPVVILTEQAATSLCKVQEQLLPYNLSLKVYDGYRPQQATNAFWEWSRDPNDATSKAEFYPGQPKDKLFERGYISRKSAHSRGSAVDVAIVALPYVPPPTWEPGCIMSDCRFTVDRRFPDPTLDFGTSFDCLDPRSWPLARDPPLDVGQARANRLLLQMIMDKHGFSGIVTEWWHFELRNEPFPETYFDFTVR